MADKMSEIFSPSMPGVALTHMKGSRKEPSYDDESDPELEADLDHSPHRRVHADNRHVVSLTQAGPNNVVFT